MKISLYCELKLFLQPWKALQTFISMILVFYSLWLLVFLLSLIPLHRLKDQVWAKNKKGKEREKPTLVHSVHLVYFNPFCQKKKKKSTLVQFRPLWSIGSILPIQSIWSILVHFGPFGPVWYTYLRMGKDKFGLSTINYLSNINCNC